MMSFETVSLVLSLSTLAVIAASAIAALIQVRQMRTANQIDATMRFSEHMERPEFREALRFVIEDLGNRLNDPIFREDLLTKGRTAPSLAEFVRVSVLFEEMGNLLKHGILDEDLLFDNHAFLINSCWDSMAPALAIMRRRLDDSLLENFEYLTVRTRQWLAAHPSAYPIGTPRMPLADQWLTPTPHEEESADGRLPPS
jgi:hypothetical protein